MCVCVCPCARARVHPLIRKLRKKIFRSFHAVMTDAPFCGCERVRFCFFRFSIFSAQCVRLIKIDLKVSADVSAQVCLEKQVRRKSANLKKKLNVSAGLTFQSGSKKDNAEDNKRRAVVCGCAHSGARAWVNRVEARATKEGFPLPYSRRRVQSSEPGSGFFFFFLNAFTLGQQRRRAAEHRVDTRSFWSPSRLNFSQSEMTRFEG